MREALLDHTLGQNTRDPDIEALVNAIPALVAKMDCNLELLFVNATFQNWFACFNGFPCHFHRAINPTLFDKIQRHLGHVLTGQSARFTVSFERNSENCFLDITLTPQFDDRSMVTAIIFHASDVTDRTLEHDALRDYFENASIGLHWVDESGIIIRVNTTELKMLGYEEQEYIGHHINEFHKNQERIANILTRLARGEVLRNYEAEMLCKDGSSRFVSINSSVRWEKNKFVHTRCFTIDITAQKMAAEAARESEERFRIIADLVPLVLWTSDENGMCTFLNQGWKELTGKEISAGAGDLWLNAVHQEDRGNIRNSWATSLARKSPFEAKMRLINPGGQYTVCYVHAIPTFDSDNKFRGYVGTMQDLSIQEQITASLERMVLDRTNDLRIKNEDLRKAERVLNAKNDELKKINNELSSFAHVASHDLQEPLRKIQVFTDRVKKAEADRLSATSLDLVNKIENASTKMRRLIRDILLYSQASNSTVPRESVDLNDLVTEIILEFEIKVQEKNALIECIDTLPVVNVIRVQFHQLFLNLLSNALKFTRPGIQPHVTISCSVIRGSHVPGLDDDEYYVVTVADNGIGFEPEWANRVFEMFNRFHSRNEYEGTGIGLAICQKIVEHHDGKIVANGMPGEGATFRIYLPTASNAGNNSL